VKRIFSVLLLLLILVPCRAAEPGGKISNLLADLTTKQLASIPPSTATITVTPKQAEVYEPIDVTLDADIPAESRVYGNGWTWSTGVRTLAVSATEQHVWAPPGKHTIAYSGVWVHTQTITVVDTSGTERTIESLLGIGMIDTSASFTVGDSPDPKPDPKPDPDPEPNPNPPLPPLANLKVVIMLESDHQQSGLEGAYLFQHLEAVKKYLNVCKVWWTTLDNSDAATWGLYSPYVPAGTALPCCVFVDDRDKSIVTTRPFGVSEYATINTLKELGVK